MVPISAAVRLNLIKNVCMLTSETIISLRNVYPITNATFRKPNQCMYLHAKPEKPLCGE